MIKLFHGSNIEITNIDLSLSKRGKDFGCGFYLNENANQALGMAKRTTRLLGCGTPTLSCFEFDIEKAEAAGLNIKIFPEYSVEWAEFIVENRKNATVTQAHDYDIVIGPIADDTVGVQIRRFIMGYISPETLIKELIFKGDNAIQYFFGTERSLKFLKKHLYES